jgi:uncharacterized protein YbcI
MVPEVDPVAAPGQVPTTVMSNAMRAAVKRLWGRGPQFVRVWFAGENTVVVLLGGILTESEKTLLAIEREHAVISQRAALHTALEPEVRLILETNIGRDTDAFMSGIDVDRDIASLVVTLRGSEPSSAPAVLTTPDDARRPRPV